eukprot:5437843-Prymnesium_polylepis.1
MGRIRGLPLSSRGGMMPGFCEASAGRDGASGERGHAATGIHDAHAAKRTRCSSRLRLTLRAVAPSLFAGSRRLSDSARAPTCIAKRAFGRAKRLPLVPPATRNAETCAHRPMFTV